MFLPKVIVKNVPRGDCGSRMSFLRGILVLGEGGGDI